MVAYFNFDRIWALNFIFNKTIRPGTLVVGRVESGRYFVRDCGVELWRLFGLYLIEIEGLTDGFIFNENTIPVS